MSIYELARKYINGLISREELQKAIDEEEFKFRLRLKYEQEHAPQQPEIAQPVIDNMGSDTRFLTIEDVIDAVK